MQDEILLTVTVVTEDSNSIGVWEVGDLDFGVMGTCREYLKKEPENREKLADWLQKLSDKCRLGQAPFQL